MNDETFDTLTRRRLGLAAGGIVSSLFGLSTLDDAEADQKKRRRRRKLLPMHERVPAGTPHGDV